MRMDSRTVYKFIAGLVFVAVLLGATTAAAVASDPDSIRIGVLAKRGFTQCKEKWGPTAEYLSRTLSPYTFQIVPLDFAAVPEAVAQKSVDFILTNSSSYVELEDQYHINAIATLINRLHCGDHKVFGGVIFCRSDDPDIHELKDLRGRNFIAVEETSLGGWRMALREFLQDGIDPRKDFKTLSFGGTHDAVVYAVQNRRADAGTVRTDTLERMAAEGKINLNFFRILNSSTMGNDSFGLLRSTRLYPEWPIAKLPHTPLRLSEQVAQTLRQIPADDPAARAAKCAGWTYPLSYQSIHECLRDLELGPYDPNALYSLGNIYRRYKPWIVSAGMLWTAIIFSAIFIVRLNTRLVSANTELKVEVGKRKKTESALEASLETAQEANIAKTQFLASMSHELRTPMNGIIGMTGILLDTPLNDEQLDFARTIMSSSRGLLRLINDILTFSDLEKGNLKLEIINFELPAAIESIVETFQAQAGKKGLVFNRLVDESVPLFLKGDANRLKQIIVNLLDNAIKFTSKGEIFLHVSVETANQTHCTLRFIVQDTGIGIPAERIENIFSSFSQVDGSFTRAFGGAGLGLALAKHFAGMMGGQIGVESIPEKGSTFWFTANLELQKAVPRLKPFQASDIHDKHILVVADSPIDRMIIEGMLRASGVSHASAETAQRALALLHQAAAARKSFDLVIIDWMMDGMNGGELGEAIKNDAVLQRIKMIMCTSEAHPEFRHRLKSIGFDAFLTKPVESSQMMNCLRLVLGPKPDPSPEIQQPKSLITEKEIEAERLNAPNILVVEDNVVNQKIIMKILGARGYRVQATDNGRKAVIELGQRSYDVVLMDLQMPEMNGFEAAAAIRNPENGCLDPHVPIIAVTANTSEEDRLLCLDAGMDDYLPKPVNPRKLVEKIQHWHKKHQKGMVSDGWCNN
jgi:two-component system sensor histidine kinase/response regulator